MVRAGLFYSERNIMLIDLLEPRRLLSVNFNASTGTLTVVGSDKVDSVQFGEEIRHPGSHNVLRLHFNGQASDFIEGSVKLIDIDTKGKADTVILGTINIPSHIVGGSGNDSLSGGDANDTIDGQGGNDYVFGRGGTDLMSGGIGYETIEGGVGNDRLIPLSDNNGDDTIEGGSGTDTVDYTNYPTKMFAFIGGSVSHLQESDKLANDIEIIIGSALNDTITNSTRRPMDLIGGAGDDTILGGSGNDTIDGGTGRDLLQGVGGKDSFRAQDGAVDTIDGGSGSDTILTSDAGDVVTHVP